MIDYEKSIPLVGSFIDKINASHFMEASDD
jgi:hypothetical protein